MKKSNVSSHVTSYTLHDAHVMFCNNPLSFKAMTNKHSTCLMVLQRFVKFILPRSPVPYSSMFLIIQAVPKICYLFSTSHNVFLEAD